MLPMPLSRALRPFRSFRPGPALAATAACALLAAAAPATAQSTANSHAAPVPANASQLASELASRYELDPAWVRAMITSARPVPDAVRLMRPAQRNGHMNWRSYRSRFVDNTRIHAGVEFWYRNEAVLARAEAEFGVPAEIIVAIIGVETIYGRNVGTFNVRDVLATLAQQFPPEHPRAAQRQAFFSDELGQFLRLCQDSGMDPTQPVGSYAGAMGIPQFMPSSWRSWAVDYDGDGRIDLWYSEADAIGSVASYFKGYGWQPGMPTHYAAYPTPDAAMDRLLEPDIEPSFTPSEMAALGVVLRPDALSHEGPLALVKLDNGNPAVAGHDPTYVAGTQNFYVVTRYNHSSYYAMAVIELGRAVAAARRHEATLAQPPR